MDSGLFRGVLHASSVYGLGGTSCVPVGSALRPPVPQNTTSMEPRCPDPEEDISGLHLRHGVRCVTSHPRFIDGRCYGDTTFTGPCHLDPEEHISAGSHLRHGVCLVTSRPPFFLGGRIGSPSSSSPESSSVSSFGISMGGLPSPPLLFLVIMGGLQPPPLFLLSPWHRGGSCFSSSPVGIMRTTSGSTHRPPVLGALFLLRLCH